MENEKKQTAVEWLAIQLYEKMEMKGDGRVFDEILEQAKQMEKEQIMDTYKKAQVLMVMDSNKQAEQYYNETFKQK